MKDATGYRTIRDHGHDQIISETDTYSTVLGMALTNPAAILFNFIHHPRS